MPPRAKRVRLPNAPVSKERELPPPSEVTMRRLEKSVLKEAGRQMRKEKLDARRAERLLVEPDVLTWQVVEDWHKLPRTYGVFVWEGLDATLSYINTAEDLYRRHNSHTRGDLAELLTATQRVWYVAPTVYAQEIANRIIELIDPAGQVVTAALLTRALVR